MKMAELLERATASNENGTYSMLQLSPDSADELINWCNDNQIDCIPKDSLHCTILYSKKPVPKLKKLNHKSVSIIAKIVKWEKLGDALVLKLDAPDASKIHKFMIDSGGASDYPEYIAHVTIQYDVPEDIKFPSVIPEFDLTFDTLVVEELNPDFKSDIDDE